MKLHMMNVDRNGLVNGRLICTCSDCYDVDLPYVEITAWLYSMRLYFSGNIAHLNASPMSYVYHMKSKPVKNQNNKLYLDIAQTLKHN